MVQILALVFGNDIRRYLKRPHGFSDLSLDRLTGRHGIDSDIQCGGIYISDIFHSFLGDGHGFISKEVPQIIIQRGHDPEERPHQSQEQDDHGHEDFYECESFVI